jgi:uncharacterized protein YbaR (Trm112 family)
MTPWLLDYLCDPADHGPLALKDARRDKKGRIISGVLVGRQGRKYPIIKGVPRFVPLGLQASVDSFGDQWNHFNFDDFHLQWLGHTVKNTFGGPAWFKGKTVVDAGGGHGMQSRWMAEAGAARVICLELSHSVDGIIRSNLTGLEDTIAVVQCSIDAPPLKPACIGKNSLVICHNVIQHTPSVEKTARALWGMVGKGGEFAFNCYTRDDSTRLQRLRFGIYSRVRRVVQSWPFWARWSYAHVLALLRFMPGLGWLLEKMNLVYRGDVRPGPRYWRRVWRGTVVGTFDYFGAQTYQHHLTLAEQRRIAKALQPDEKKWRNAKAYFHTKPMPIGTALRLSK